MIFFSTRLKFKLKFELSRNFELTRFYCSQQKRIQISDLLSIQVKKFISKSYMQIHTSSALTIKVYFGMT
jgi:hypothetical protein